ncbi:cyclophilin-like domain-containing protein [Leucosporidium creatinivorum]|uniref:Peptidyl-prolyl cis-trans isomerase n=1 Tax=Leucosporidium creatinivorum TaxID=106004 RepID=A0A1Y2F9U9_9BASI|nr:cyclophilin-like domain-containing protein [Leucosporidium creatinivorum]
MEPTHCWIDFAAGDQAAYDVEEEAYQKLASWVAKNGGQYGLPSELGELDEVGQETLKALYEGETKVVLEPSSFSPPTPLTLPRLHLLVSPSPNLSKTTTNFLALLSDSKGLFSKQRSAQPIPLRYAGSKVFRVDRGFVAQGGDVTRQDGSGGESIYGGSFNDEKEGLKTSFQLGTIAMANSGKNSNTSQFFVTLTSDPVKLKKLTGKYVAFGETDLKEESSRACLTALDALGNGKGGTNKPVWIAECGL